MADLSDVLHALRDVISAVLYPAGVPTGSTPQSEAGAPVRVYVGWPGADLDADIKAGVCQVTIWPRAGMARNLGPYLTGWQEMPAASPSLTATVADSAVTFGGTGATPGMLAAVVVEHSKAYTYPLEVGDGPAQVTQALAAQVSADYAVVIDPPATLRVLGVPSIAARVAAVGTERREVRRLAQSIQITAWCPNPALRDAIVRLIDDALIEDHRTLAMPDGTVATLTYEGTGYDEEGRQQPLHRRDLLVSAEYIAARLRSEPRIVVPGTEYQTDPAVIRRTILS